ncbi:nitrous oxide reductase accessory protein NosL [Neobacillus rhizosphaerae]|uniref:nitrous oxide reductase accessory protein NosL n=1 Tax=Neobacillus rhizosphaerae TaxID=2880965 RepID=UPI003D2A0806
MKANFIKITLLTVISLLLISGCGKEEPQPVAINEKTDKCEICHMAVKDNQFSTEIILENGKAIVFDDIGCMYSWIKENTNQKIASSFVKDYQTKEWIKPEKAAFVYDKTIKTPMAYNVIAFSDKKDAESFINKNGGTLLTYDKLDDHSWERNEDMVKEMKGKMMKMNDGKEGMDMEHSEDSHE